MTKPSRYRMVWLHAQTVGYDRSFAGWRQAMRDLMHASPTIRVWFLGKRFTADW